ncbi:MAG: hypothetical protein ABSA21_01290 [Candidatus Limnocylindrales bacterium]
MGFGVLAHGERGRCVSVEAAGAATTGTTIGIITSYTPRVAVSFYGSGGRRSNRATQRRSKRWI